MENQKIKYDKGKLQYSLLPFESIDAMVDIMTWAIDPEQRDKPYKKGSWKEVDIERYIDALGRHYSAYCKGEKLDQESLKHHMAHIMCNAAFILSKELDTNK